MKAVLHFDGSRMKNPGGIGAGAAVLKTNDEQHESSRFIESCTNNEAEYVGIIVGLEKALVLGVTEIECFGDSQLVIRQLAGEWSVKSDTLRKFWAEARLLTSKFRSCNLTWIPRDLNAEADTLCAKCIQLKLKRKTAAHLPVGNLRHTHEGI